jgi:uncharacterized protein YfbU (UPF0304 family)
MELTKKERVFLINQYRILASLNRDDASHYQELIEVLENGYEYCYYMLDEWISEGMAEEDGKFVVEVLNLYRAIENIKRATKSKQLHEHPNSFFRGFDGNNETQHMSFCRFLIETQGRFQEQQQYLPSNDNLNSHMPMVDLYTRMLEEAKQIPDIWNMSADDALRILNA